MNQQEEAYGLDGAIGGGTGQIAGSNSGHVSTRQEATDVAATSRCI